MLFYSITLYHLRLYHIIMHHMISYCNILCCITLYYIISYIYIYTCIYDIQYIILVHTQFKARPVWGLLSMAPSLRSGDSLRSLYLSEEKGENLTHRRHIQERSLNMNNNITAHITISIVSYAGQLGGTGFSRNPSALDSIIANVPRRSGDGQGSGM